MGRRAAVGTGMTLEPANPAAVLLRPERTLLVLVDLQEKLMPAISGSERVLANSVLLLRVASVLRLPVVLTTQYRKGLGDVVPRVREAAPGVEPLDKVTFGCFWNDAFNLRLDAFPERDQLVVAGVESHICVCQTVLGALEKSYAAHVAGDAIGSRTEANHRIGLARMERAGALVSSAEMAIYELLGRSDADAFKKLLPHLKGEPQ
jgi:nicotinamidase-related amidase